MVNLLDVVFLVFKYEPMLYFSSTILVTLLVSILICHWRTTHSKRISVGTVFVSAVIANVAILASLGLYELGRYFFTLEAWIGPRSVHAIDFDLVVLGCITILCFLPALVVAVCYERWSNKIRRPCLNKIE
jgi:hypothetical protein